MNVEIMKKETTAQCLIRVLTVNGVDRAFCVPGESYLPVLDALYDAKEQIELITCRQESGAGNMAEAYGKLTGKAGICFVTRGPGAANASVAVHTAFQDSTPMILFIGQVARNHSDREAFQEIDYRQMFGSVAKWVARIDHGGRLAEYVSRAFHVALSGRPGPVVLALPEDMLKDEIPRVEILPAHNVEACISPDDLKTLHDALSTAQRPLVILGGSGWDRQSVNNVQDFIQKNQLPVAVAFRCQDLFDNRLDNYLGDVGIGLNPDLGDRIKSADLILCIGPRLGEITTGGYRLFDPPFPAQKIIMIHSGAEESGHVYRPFMAINSSMKNIARALGSLPVIPSPPWTGFCASGRTAFLDWNRPRPTVGAVDIGALYHHLRDHMPDDAILTNGAGNYSIWLHRFMVYKYFRSQLAPTSGAMGYGLPAAIAAKLTCPGRPVVCFTGDGDFMMTAQELATISHHQVNIIILLFNNSMYGTIRMHQERNFADRVIATDLTNPDFAAFAQSFGLNGVTVRKSADFAPAFQAALRANKTTLIEIIVDSEALTPTATLNQIRTNTLERQEKS